MIIAKTIKIYSESLYSMFRELSYIIFEFLVIEKTYRNMADVLGPINNK